MRRGMPQIKIIFFVLLVCFVVLSTMSGYLYRENKKYQYENRRLIVVNDSVLSENLELKNSLLQKPSSALIKNGSENFQNEGN
jgi:hypothetical protein